MSEVKHGKNYKRKVIYWDEKKEKKLGVTLIYEDGYAKTLLNGNGKARKYAGDIKHKHYQNPVDGTVLTDDKGKVIPLSKSGQAYRSGYLDARKDSAAAYKANKSRD